MVAAFKEVTDLLNDIRLSVLGFWHSLLLIAHWCIDRHQ